MAGLVFFLAFASSDCRAITRDGRICRNNSRGFLGGCYLEQHKKQTAWRRLMAGPPGPGGWPARYWEELFGSPRQVVVTLGPRG